MKFGLFLLEHMVSEWNLFYIDYHKIKTKKYPQKIKDKKNNYKIY